MAPLSMYTCDHLFTSPGIIRQASLSLLTTPFPMHAISIMSVLLNWCLNYPYTSREICIKSPVVGEHCCLQIFHTQ